MPRNAQSLASFRNPQILPICQRFKHTAVSLRVMQAESHWVLKDFLTIVTLFGVFYNMQEGRDGNPLIRKAISTIESRYDQLNTWMAQSSEAEIVARLWVITRWMCIAGIVLVMCGAKIYPHPTHLLRSSVYVVGGLLFVFYICNQQLADDRRLDWTPFKWGVLAALILLVLSAFFQFADIQIARAVPSSLAHTPLNLPFRFESAYLPLISGAICAAALTTIGLVLVAAQALPSLFGRLALRLTLRSMKGLATFIAWLDPKRKFAWFMFLVCALLQLVSNHL